MDSNRKHLLNFLHFLKKREKQYFILNLDLPPSSLKIKADPTRLEASIISRYTAYKLIWNQLIDGLVLGLLNIKSIGMFGYLFVCMDIVLYIRIFGVG